MTDFEKSVYKDACRWAEDVNFYWHHTQGLAPLMEAYWADMLGVS